ncbi:hypothetical protein Tco_1114710 [Tanacetum coccineum]|uniref:Uncharacterized protein n=1 Tax=Tanacetum coccineum TaxID=301880 RepID=A0ABQ5IVX5_9ASTR
MFPRLDSWKGLQKAWSVNVILEGPEMIEVPNEQGRRRQGKSLRSSGYTSEELRRQASQSFRVTQLACFLASITLTVKSGHFGIQGQMLSPLFIGTV